jgi:hypothetical protein
MVMLALVLMNVTFVTLGSRCVDIGDCARLTVGQGRCGAGDFAEESSRWFGHFYRQALLREEDAMWKFGLAG